MDALDLLSDAEDDDDLQVTKRGAEEPPEEAPAAKQPRVGAPVIDFEALRKAGYGGDGEAEAEAERKAAKQALEGTVAALEKEVHASTPGAGEPAPGFPPPKKKPQEGGHVEFPGCELPPESIEVYDETAVGGDWEPWSTLDQAEQGLGPVLIGAMRAAGFSAPTPIQANAWPILSSGRDLIGVARTGSGKTLAFLLPCFAKLLKEGLRSKNEATGGGTGEALPVQMQKLAQGAGAFSPEVLVLAPSRELAAQIETEAKKFTSSTGVATLACYGGEGSRREQLGRLRERPECVVGTVGRLIDFIENEKHWFGVKNVRFLILDEADHMLGEGLDANIRKITCDVETPRRQTMLFSATFADDVRDLSTWITRHAVEVRVGMKDPLRANRDINQKIVIVKDDFDKEGALKNILRMQYAANARNPGKVLVFAADPEECDNVCKKLRGALNGAQVETLHGNKKQSEREQAMADFRTGKVPILVATNIAGRGLDVKDINLVINYDPPEDGQDYVHRIGRTGRAGRKGTAVTLLRKGPDGRAMIYITQVMRRTGIEVPKDLIEALKQRRGRDMSLAAEALQGLCQFEKLERTWAKAF